MGRIRSSPLLDSPGKIRPLPRLVTEAFFYGPSTAAQVREIVL
jgi:hypothetical protein